MNNLYTQKNLTILYLIWRYFTIILTIFERIIFDDIIDNFFKWTSVDETFVIHLKFH